MKLKQFKNKCYLSHSTIIWNNIKSHISSIILHNTSPHTNLNLYLKLSTVVKSEFQYQTIPLIQSQINSQTKIKSL